VRIRAQGTGRINPDYIAVSAEIFDPAEPAYSDQSFSKFKNNNLNKIQTKVLK